MSALRKGRRRGKAPSKRAMRGRQSWSRGIVRAIAACAEYARLSKQLHDRWFAIATFDYGKAAP